jgi:hypothetical protein
LKLNTTFAAIMAALAACPTGAVAEVYSCEIREWVRVNDEGLFGLRQVHLLKVTYRSTRKPGMLSAMRCRLQIVGELLKRVRKKTRS